jgi:hypothetical protein
VRTVHPHKRLLSAAKAETGHGYYQIVRCITTRGAKTYRWKRVGGVICRTIATQAEYALIRRTNPTWVF